VIVSCKEFAYTDDATLESDVAAWLETLRAARTPARDLKINFIAINRVLVTAVYGGGFAMAAPET
jgi:hypothetical protein